MENLPNGLNSKHYRVAWDRFIPVSAVLELTLKCNLKCVHCYNFDRSSPAAQKQYGSLTMEKTKVFSVLKELADAGVLSLAFTGGESLLHPNLDEFVRIALMFLLAAAIFSFSLPLTFFPLMLIVQLSAIPLFFSFGILSAAIFLFTGRGDSVVNYAGLVLMTFSGAYFPLSVLPGWLQTGINLVSPYKHLLDLHRNLAAGLAGPSDALRFSLSLLVSGLLLWPIGAVLFAAAIRRIKKGGITWIRVL